jgi:hypothetical protein
MIKRINRHPVISVIACLGAAALIGMVVFGIYLASATDSLPWQSDPTRIPVPTAFTDAGGFKVPTPLPTATKAP